MIDLKKTCRYLGVLAIMSQSFLSASPSLLHASGDAPPALELSLQQAVIKALKANTDIQVKRENIRANQYELRWEQAQFDPAFLFDFRVSKVKRLSTLSFETDTVIQENQRLSLGLSQRLRWGGDYNLSLGQRRSSNSISRINPTYNGDLIFSFTQPLLKGYGREITETPLRVARTEIGISREDFESQVSSVILEVSKAYWDLVFKIKNRAVQQQTLASARQLLASSRAKVALGILAPIEILVAESGVASRQEAVVIAEKAIRDQEDQLRLLLNLPEQARFSAPPIRPTDRPIEEKEMLEPSDLMAAALVHRPEILAHRHRLQNRARAFKRALDQLSPSLDLVGNIGLSGLDEDFSGELDRLSSRDFNQWELGLVLSFPLGRRAAKAALQKEKVRLNLARLARKKTVQQITLETKEGIRRVQTNFKRMTATRRARHLAEEKKAAGRERFQLGLISSHDLLEFQDDLADAQGRALKAVIDYNKSLSNLAHVTGRLLEEYQIELSPSSDPESGRNSESGLTAAAQK